MGIFHLMGISLSSLYFPYFLLISRWCQWKPAVTKTEAATGGNGKRCRRQQWRSKTISSSLCYPCMDAFGGGDVDDSGCCDLPLLTSLSLCLCLLSLNAVTLPALFASYCNGRSCSSLPPFLSLSPLLSFFSLSFSLFLWEGISGEREILERGRRWGERREKIRIEGITVILL